MRGLEQMISDFIFHHGSYFLVPVKFFFNTICFRYILATSTADPLSVTSSLKLASPPPLVIGCLKLRSLFT